MLRWGCVEYIRWVNRIKRGIFDGNKDPPNSPRYPAIKRSLHILQIDVQVREISQRSLLLLLEIWTSRAVVAYKVRWEPIFGRDGRGSGSGQQERIGERYCESERGVQEERKTHFGYDVQLGCLLFGVN